MILSPGKRRHFLELSGSLVPAGQYIGSIKLVTGQERKQSKRGLPQILGGGFFLRKSHPAELAPGYIYSGSAIGVGFKPPQIYLNCP
jgi:hypothetical protein